MTDSPTAIAARDEGLELLLDRAVAELDLQQREGPAERVDREL